MKVDEGSSQWRSFKSLITLTRRGTSVCSGKIVITSQGSRFEDLGQKGCTIDTDGISTSCAYPRTSAKPYDDLLQSPSRKARV